MYYFLKHSFLGKSVAHNQSVLFACFNHVVSQEQSAVRLFPLETEAERGEGAQQRIAKRKNYDLYFLYSLLK